MFKESTLIAIIRGAIYEGIDRSAVPALRLGVEDTAAVADTVFLALKSSGALVIDNNVERKVRRS
jgi:hypothetical protein